MIQLIMPFGTRHGWGICGTHLAQEMAKLADVRCVAPEADRRLFDNDLDYRFFKRLIASAEQQQWLMHENDRDPILQGISDHRLKPIWRPVAAPRKVGYTFFESTEIARADVEQAQDYFDLVVAGSSWCAEQLVEAGLPNVVTVIQGVDPTRFHPGHAEKDLFRDRFAVFSGGKFELRKGHDIVIRAYKVLQDRHADVMLVNSWYNPWRHFRDMMGASPLIQYQATSPDDGKNIANLLDAHGIDLERVVTLPPYANASMPRIYRNTDVGLFPNRCEGGTNLVMMEYMACGKPVIASNCSGHADIINHNVALPIASRGKINVDINGKRFATWDEPDLDETIQHLEWAYQNSGNLPAIGSAAGEQMRQFTWTRCAQQFFELLDYGP